MQELRLFFELSFLNGGIRAVRSTVVVGIHGRLAQASGERQMANVYNDGPKLGVGQNTSGGGHAGRRDPVLQDPVQLSVRVGLNCR